MEMYLDLFDGLGKWRGTPQVDDVKVKNNELDKVPNRNASQDRFKRLTPTGCDKV